MERTNIAEILKNAPKGLKLWSDAHGVVELEKVDTDSCYPIYVKCGNGVPDNFRDNGALFYDESFYPCTLWPSKDHRSWSGWQDILLKAGDVVVNKNNNKVEIMRDVQTMWADNGTFHTFSSLCSYRYATPEEREQFFKELEANGYKWNGKEVVKVEEEIEPMTLEEAIKHCEEKACDNTECGREHKQLAEWLKELNQWREDYTNHKIDETALCLEKQGIIDRLDSIFNLLNERLPIRLVPFTDTYPRPIEPRYNRPLTDVQANTGKEEDK